MSKFSPVIDSVPQAVSGIFHCRQHRAECLHVGWENSSPARSAEADIRRHHILQTIPKLRGTGSFPFGSASVWVVVEREAARARARER